MEDRSRILLVMPPEAQSRIIRALPDSDVYFCLAGNCEELRQLYRADEPLATEADVIVVALTLEDGNWRSVIREAVGRSAPAEVIVALPDGAGDASHLAEFGATQVIRPPYDSPEAQAAIRTTLEKKRAAEVC